MCKVKCIVEDGFINSEQVVQITTSEGRIEEVFVSRSIIENDTIHVARIGSDHSGRVLIELPRESASGHWRIWVNKDQIAGQPVGVT